MDDVQKTPRRGRESSPCLIVFVFLNSWRSTVITGLALPVSVLASFLAFNMFGFAQHDDAHGALARDRHPDRRRDRRAREHRASRGSRRDHDTAARNGIGEISFAVLATTMSIVAVFVPVAFMGGIPSVPLPVRHRDRVRRARVAVRVVHARPDAVEPLVRFPQAEGGSYDGPVRARAQAASTTRSPVSAKRYRAIIHWALGHRVLTLVIAALSLVIAFAARRQALVGGEFMPRSDSEETSVAFRAPPGSSLAYTRDKGPRTRALPRVTPRVSTYLTVGGEGANNAVNRGAIYVKMTPPRRASWPAGVRDRHPVLALHRLEARITRWARSAARPPIVINLNGPRPRHAAGAVGHTTDRHLRRRARGLSLVEGAQTGGGSWTWTAGSPRTSAG